MPLPDKSSFLRREMSKEDAIKQIYRPRVAGRVTQAMDLFDRLVTDFETITKLGEKLVVKGQDFHLTPEDLKESLDEFPEIEQIALQGRALLISLGYVRQRQNTPQMGVAPVGENVEVVAISTQLPGSEPLHGVLVNPVEQSKE